MVVCKFFLQGRCKFGDFCNFEHQISDNFNSYQNGTSILRQPNFGATQPQSNFGTPQIQPAKSPVQASSSAATSAVDTATLVKSVVNDMTSAEKGGQWLLSCYAPFKEKPAFPGFEDQSFEELRFAHHEALKSGSLEQYKQQVQLMIQQIQMKIKSLQNPSPDMVNLLKNIYDTPPSSQSGVFSGNLFNSPNTTSLNQQGTGFGQQGISIFAQANQNLFGKTQQQQTISQSSFGSTGTNIFGNTNQNSIFGGQTVTNNPFGTSQPPQTASGAMFGNTNFNLTSSGNSIYGVQQSPPQQTTGSIFGNTNLIVSAQSVPQQSPFGNQSVFGQPTPQNTGILSSSAGPQQIQANIFGQPQAVQTHQAVMQNQQAPTNIFGGAVPQQKTTGSIFGQQTGVGFGDNVNSPFGPAKSNAGIQAQSPSISGGFTFSKNSVQPDETLYSKLEDLTEEEIKWFNSDDLDIMKIPEKPPTYQMCFKT